MVVSPRFPELEEWWTRRLWLATCNSFCLWETGSGIFTRREKERERERKQKFGLADGQRLPSVHYHYPVRDRGSWPNKVEAGSRITVGQLPPVSRGWLIAIVALRCRVLGRRGSSRRDCDQFLSLLLQNCLENRISLEITSRCICSFISIYLYLIR